jgi:hypothetical protein
MHWKLYWPGASSLVFFIAAAQVVSHVEAFTPTFLMTRQQQNKISLLVRNLETKEKATSEKEKKGLFPFIQNSKEAQAPNGVAVEQDAATAAESKDEITEKESNESFIPENSLVALTAIIGTCAVALHAGDYAAFFQSLSEMKANADPGDFWPAVNFWIFFAVGHAILQPIFWISEVLHASPGPKIADLVPVSFLIGNVVAIGAVTFSKEVSTEWFMYPLQ